ncbi:hypothetical protein WA158_004338 [Blastocystis sp. Blastoise]
MSEQKEIDHKTITTFYGDKNIPCSVPSSTIYDKHLPPFSLPLGIPKSVDISEEHLDDGLLDAESILDKFIDDLNVNIDVPEPDLTPLPQLELTTCIEQIPLDIGSKSKHIIGGETDGFPLSSTIQEYTLSSASETNNMSFTRQLNNEENVMGNINSVPFLPGGLSVELKPENHKRISKEELGTVLQSTISQGELQNLLLNVPTTETPFCDIQQQSEDTLHLHFKDDNYSDSSFFKSLQNGNQTTTIPANTYASYADIYSSIKQNVKTTSIYDFASDFFDDTPSTYIYNKKDTTSSIDSIFDNSPENNHGEESDLSSVHGNSQETEDKEDVSMLDSFISPSIPIPSHSIHENSIQSSNNNNNNNNSDSDTDSDSDNDNDVLTPENKQNIINESRQLIKEADKHILPLSDSKLSISNTLTWCITDTQNVNNMNLLIPHMALTFPFELDTFQKRAIYRVERGESVYVCAHTSAGKTVVAEYAIALCKKHMTKCIYTSPIKALSNQKYRDFKEKFGDVGIMTGDVSINPKASCLIMTTEILRSMLYRGADIIRDIEVIVFDEAHYINNDDRGVVWEETIIMLPNTVNTVFLSATTPNAKDICDWIGRVKKRKVYVEETSQRPVPLEHHVFFNNKDVVMLTPEGNFLENNYKQLFKSADDKAKMIVDNPQQMRVAISKEELNSFINRLLKSDNIPAVFFIFSRKSCNELAQKAGGNSLITAEESGKIRVFIDSCLKRLKKEDQELPQIKTVSQLLLNGVGVHHAGLLPILKEMVELLFANNYLKVLFATETFAMGVNMPAKCVVYPQIIKFDGMDFRYLKADEYTQMSGRAGRRGLDVKGTVIQAYFKKIPTVQKIKGVMVGIPTKIESKFRLTYSMLLNLLRFQDISVEEMIERSFSEVKTLREREKYDFPTLLNQLKTKRRDLTCYLDDCVYGGNNDIEDFYKDYRSKRDLLNNVITTIIRGENGSTFVKKGRILYILYTFNDRQFFVPCCVKSPFDESHKTEVIIYIPADFITSNISVDVINDGFYSLKNVRSKTVTNINGLNFIVDIIPDSSILFVSTLVSSINVSNLSSINSMLSTCKSLYDDLSNYNEEDIVDIDKNKYIYNYFENVRSYDPSLYSEWQRYIDVNSMMRDSKCVNCVRHHERMNLMSVIYDIDCTINSINTILSTKGIENFPELDNRLRVLRRLGYVDASGVITLKGRTGCYLQDDNILLVEMIFNNVFDGLTPAELAACVSAFCLDKDSDDITTDQRLLQLQKVMIENGSEFARVEIDEGMNIDITEFLASNLHCTMMQATYEWCRGRSFADITRLVSFDEGIIVRCMLELDQALKKLCDVAKTIGNSQLYDTANNAAILLKRDIVFSPSLYVV